MPIEIFWKVDEMVKESYFLTSSHESKELIAEIEKRILANLLRYTSKEADRVWIQNRLKNRDQDILQAVVVNSQNK